MPYGKHSVHLRRHYCRRFRSVGNGENASRSWECRTFSTTGCVPFISLKAWNGLTHRTTPNWSRGVLGRSWHSYNERLLALHNIGNICAYALRPFHYFHRLDTAFLHFQSGFQAFSFDIKYFPQNNALNFAIFKTFGIFGAILKPNTQKAHGSARLDWVKNGTHEIRVLN